MDLDKSLDSILAAKPKQTRKPKAVLAKSANGVKKATAKPAPQKAKTAVAKAAALDKIPAQASKIIVHGLPIDVTEKQIKEYMTAEIGPIHRCELAYNREGKSKGVATITFQRGGKENYAQKACTLLNGRAVDQTGPRPAKMRVEVVTEVKQPGLADRLGGLPKTVVAAVNKTQSKVKAKKLKKTGPGRVKKVPKTAAELDAEMTVCFS